VDAPVKVGLLGTGNIAPAYIKAMRAFDILDVVACADLDVSRAEAFAQANDLQALSVDALLADPDIEIIVNLTIPQAHAEVSAAIIAAGKHVYSEKPLALNRDDAAALLAAADEAGVRAGCAPDTFLGGGLQTSRRLIDTGAIGDPVGATACFASHGPESWHPNAGFYYQRGGGPLYDMGPYYLTALVHLLGPIASVQAITRRTFDERIATSEALNGTRLPVEVNTHNIALLEMAGGVPVTFISSFDVWGHSLPRMEVYGSETSISIPDPNFFAGPVRLWRREDRTWDEAALTHPDDVGRGIGVADMAHAIRSGRPHRASGALAAHVVDVMQAFDEASESGHAIPVASTVEQPAALPLDLPQGALDA
jgi:predicted dehydrogenase